MVTITYNSVGTGNQASDMLHGSLMLHISHYKSKVTIITLLFLLTIPRKPHPYKINNQRPASQFQESYYDQKELASQAISAHSDKKTTVSLQLASTTSWYTHETKPQNIVCGSFILWEHLADILLSKLDCTIMFRLGYRDSRYTTALVS